MRRAGMGFKFHLGIQTGMLLPTTNKTRSSVSGQAFGLQAQTQEAGTFCRLVNCSDNAHSEKARESDRKGLGYGNCLSRRRLSFNCPGGQAGDNLAFGEQVEDNGGKSREGDEG